MITAYRLLNGRVIVDAVAETAQALPPGTTWIDVLQPTAGERAIMTNLLGIDLPTQEEMHEIESSSRLYNEEDTAYMTTSMVSQAETEDPLLADLTFVLTRKVLVTLRHAEQRSFNTFAMRIHRQPELLATGEDALMELIDCMIGRLADVLEGGGARLDMLSKKIFRQTLADPTHKPRRIGADELQSVLREIGMTGALMHQLRETLNGLDRLLTYFNAMTGHRLSKPQKARVKTVGRDLRSLLDHVAHLMQESSFLLDATLGVISAAQNDIIKIFSIAAVVFLPPTLIASIYGMNFEFMPEKVWHLGYPLSLLLMLLSGIGPLWYFRRKGWL
jgi:magnesium transporter